MPIYEFECNECGKVFSVNKAMEEKAVSHCPICESPNTKRLWDSEQLRNLHHKGCGGCSSGGSCGGGCNCK